jgi:hypothetical protein
MKRKEKKDGYVLVVNGHIKKMKAVRSSTVGAMT